MRRVLSFCLVLTTLSTQSASATDVINLSKQNLRVALLYYHRPAPSGGGNLSTLGVQDDPEGWYVQGWNNVAPGENFHFPGDTFFRVEQNGNQVSFNGLGNINQLAHPSINFKEFLGKDGRRQDNFQQRGFRGVTYSKHPKNEGGFSVGNDYQILKKDFNFTFGSRDYTLHNKAFPVDGFVISTTVNVTSSRYAKNVFWGRRGNEATVSLSTEGKRGNAGAFGIGQPRERGYYEGTVTVEYTKRR